MRRSFSIFDISALYVETVNMSVYQYEITYIMNYYNIRKQVYAKDKSYWYTDMFTVSTYNAEMSKILNDLLIDFVSGYVPGH